MAILKLAAVATCLTLVACQREPTVIELSERDVVVHGILVGGEDSVRVFIGRASATNTYDMPIPVVDAQVRLVAGDQTINLTRRGRCLAHEAIGTEPGNRTMVVIARVCRAAS